jgi:hypothetical protein
LATVDPVGALTSASGMLNNPGAVTPASVASDSGDDPSTALYKALSSKHPDYMAWEDKWRIYRDCVDDSQFQKEFYLHQNEREVDSQYRFRLEISEFLPDTPSYIDRIAGALYAEKPKRDFKGDKKLVDFAERVTKSRRASLASMDNFMERVIRALLTYGVTRVLITTKVAAPEVEGSVVTRADEIKAGARPYACLYTPLSVIDWSEDEDGELDMARVVETYSRKVDPQNPQSPHVEYTRFTQYDKQTAQWWVFRRDPEDETKWIEDGSLGGVANHGLGLVPMVVHYWPDMVKCMIGQSYIRYMARAEVSRFRNESDLDYDAHMHAHPALCIKTNEKIKSEVVIGGGRYIRLRPKDNAQEGEDAFYLEYPTPAHDALRELIDAKTGRVRRYAAVDPTGAIDDNDSGQATSTASGVSRAWSFGTTEARTLSSLADAAAEIEAAIFDLVLRYYGEQPDPETGVTFSGEVQYPEEFEVAATDALLDQAERAGEFVNSETYHRYLHKRLVRSNAGDAGQDTLEEIFEEIDNNEVRVPAVQEPPADIMGFPRGPAGQAAAAKAMAEAEDEDDMPMQPRAAPKRPKPTPAKPPARRRTGS